MSTTSLYRLNIFRKKGKTLVKSFWLPGEYLTGMGKKYPKSKYRRYLLKVGK